MSRLAHSASSAKIGAACERAWAYTYLDGLREPEVAWSEIERGLPVPPRVRSLSLGKAVHAIGEAYFRGESVAWESLPGRIFASGVQHLPRPQDCQLVEVERPIGRPCADVPQGAALTVHGVRWVGLRDLLVRSDAFPLTQVDYKTTASIARYALTPDQLRDDLQACLYTIDLCERFGHDVWESRWLYLETKRVRRSLPVDVSIERDHALGIVAPHAERARRLDALTSSADAEPNTLACHDYGGCRFHVSQGGPCDAQRSLRAYFAREAKRGTKMALDQAMMARFNVAPPPPPPAEAPAAAAPPPPPAEAPPPAPAAAASTEAPAKRRGRPPKAAPQVAASGAAPAAGSLAAQLAEIIAELAEAEAEVEAAKARIAELLA